MAQNKPSAISNGVSTSQHVIIGVLVGFDHQNRPLVAFSGNPQSTAIPASYTSPLSHDDIGYNVALLLVGGDIEQPLIIGPIKDSLEQIKIEPESLIQYKEKTDSLLSTIQVDGEEELIITANKTITLQCGDASITLTKEGKILLRGKYISSRASGMQTIKGGSVQIN